MIDSSTTGIASRPGPVHVLGISGSLRRGSFNTALLREARELAPDGIQIDLFDLKGVPLYDADLEAQGDPEEVAALKSAVRRADALLLATPEYNGGLTAPLKNAIDWASRSEAGYRESAIFGKPTAVMGGGGGGAEGAQAQLRQVLSALGIQTVERPEVKVAAVWGKFDEDGRLNDQATKRAILELLLALGNRLSLPLTSDQLLAA